MSASPDLFSPPVCASSSAAHQVHGEAPEPVELMQRAMRGHVDHEVSEWLALGFARHAAGEPIDFALRLDRVSRRRARDRALVRAAELLGPRPSVWQTALALAAAVRRFEGRVLPFLGDGRALGPVDAALAAAHAALPKLPRTPEGLLYLLK